MLVLNLLLLLLLFILQSEASKEDDSWYLEKQKGNETGIFQQSRIHVLRLGPGEDLLDSIFRYARVTKISAASIVSVVGSLTKTNIRYANQEEGTSLSGHFEIVSVVGNIDMQPTSGEGRGSAVAGEGEGGVGGGEEEEDDESSGSGHVHIALSDELGTTIGGHLLSGNIVYTTAEISILEAIGAQFSRVQDTPPPSGSGYYELQVHRTD